MRVSRRGVLVGGAVAVGGVVAAAGLVEYDVLPGRSTAYDVLGLNGEAGVVPDTPGGPIRRGTLRGADWVIIEPPEPEPGLPVALALHGARSDAETWVSRLHLDRFLAASGQRFALAAIDGGPSSYWHPRADGSDTGALVLSGLLPLLASRGYDVSRPGFLGWSMGGYGAMLLATERVDAGLPVGPVLAVSPAVWDDLEDAPAGAFDDAADFEDYGMFDRRDLLDGLDVRVDCGRGDPLFHQVTDFTDGQPMELHIEPGAHEPAYWTRVLPDQLTWLGDRLSATGAP
ncbi:putative esterase [metagenome]|uniref:Putative esterase n=1 Tax=metagenome TaxID=256318 RepID=A0A2P2BYC5_9ZZZZ